MSDRMTLLDFAKSKKPDGTQAHVIELMQQYNPMISDAPAYPANAPYGNRTTLRRVLPVVGTAKINKGVSRSKSETDQRQDTIGYFAGRSEIDARLMDLEGSAAFGKKRMDEDKCFEEALAQLICNTTAYGDLDSDEASFDGAATRMASLNAGTTMTDSQVWSQGTVTGSDGCSIYIMDWGERAAHLIFPPNTTSGLMVKDLGEQDAEDEDGAKFRAYVTLYDFYVGLCVKDPRHIARLANIDLSDALAGGSVQGIMLDNLEQMMAHMAEPGEATRVLYCPVKLWAAFTKQARSQSNQALSIRDYLGKPTPHFWDYPLRKVEQLSVAEATVS